MAQFEQMDNTEYDLLIIGGGLAGASLAVALADSPYRVAVIEAYEVDAAAQPSYDERTIALTYSARHIFNQLGVWDAQVEADACAINSIQISNKGHWGLTHLSHLDAGTPALGYVVPTRTLGRALTQGLSKAKNIDFFCPYQASSVELEDEFAVVSIESSQSNTNKRLKARLAVIADGGRSPLLGTLGFEKQQHPYTQSALLSIVSSNQPHQNKAYEHFMADGPLALLPMTDQRFAVVWTLSADELARVEGLSDSDYLSCLQDAFGTRAGLFSLPGKRKTYPLARSLLDTPYRERILVLGNAAHTVHPVAGQGFNLGLRDVAELAERLLNHCDAGTDIGAQSFLQGYAESRRKDTEHVGQFTDGLLKVFSHRSALISIGRNLGLSAVENLPFIKRALLRRSMGLGKHQPRLARGLNIRRRSSNK